MKSITRRHFVGSSVLASALVLPAGCKKEPAATASTNPEAAACADGVCAAPGAESNTDTKSALVCSPASTLLFACSGAADTGEIADRAARALTRAGKGKMFCLAGVGGAVEPLVEGTKKAQTLIAIDGCAMGCTAQCLRKAGFDKFNRIVVTDLGLEKGKSPATQENIDKVVTKAGEFFKEA
ncbi:MAG: putative zinc-binding protein [Sedimentisphaerales bacterium]|nr:putative zinc-binding protein [Sedimentisphaerales bacterium]